MILIALSLAGCSVGRPTEVPATSTPAVVIVTATPEPTATPTEVPPEPELPGRVSTLDGIKEAVIQIEAQGTFVDPEFGWQMNAAGRGSGFIIDPSGVAVTNNHVATGAAFLKVWVGGESRSRTARVLGASECSDLAVIQIEGSDLPYLEWYDGPVRPGLEVYVAGFPLGDPEYTLTRGIVSKERADGNTDWASVDYVIEHDAQLNPGNSGGPLITKDGQVVGINFAGRASTRQSYAIGYQEAKPLVEELRKGQDLTSIGVNGQVVGDDDGLTGIWVASVKSGSPADRAGIKGGDIVLQLEGLSLGRDGTMADYCRVLRSHAASDVMAITVLRYSTGELLEGQLNGREMKVTQALREDPSTPQPEPRPTAPEGEYVTIRDDSGALEVEVPRAWGDVRGTSFKDDDGAVRGAMLVAAPNVSAFLNSSSFPGIVFIASRWLVGRHTVESILDDSRPSFCLDHLGREEYDDGLYVGMMDLYGRCNDDPDASMLMIAAMPAEQDALITVWVGFDAEDAQHMAALERIIDTFQIVGRLP